MPSIDHRDKVIRLLAPRQKWPLNLDRNDVRQPKWQEILTRSPFPSNLLYGRPRSIDRSINNPPAK